jgi:hypothetical protein
MATDRIPGTHQWNQQSATAKYSINIKLGFRFNKPEAMVNLWGASAVIKHPHNFTCYKMNEVLFHLFSF